MTPTSKNHAWPLTDCVLARSILIGLCIALVTAASAFDFGSVVKKATKEASKAAQEAITEQPAAGQDTASLVKQANKELRNAQNSMFSGKKEKSLQQLNHVAELLEKIKAADPDNPRLNSLTQKYEKQKKDLDRRMGKTSARPSGRAQPVKAEPAGAVAAKPAKGGKLPYHAKQSMRRLDNAFRSIDYHYKKLEAFKEGESQSMPLEERLAKLEGEIAELQSLLDAVKEQAAQKGVTEHPTLAEAQARIDAEPAKFATIKAETQQLQAEGAAAAGEAATDVAELQKEYERLREKVFNKAGGHVIYYNDLEPAKELLVVIEDFEKNDRANAEALLETFGKKYGTEDEEIEEKAGDRQAVYAYKGIREGIDKVAKSRSVMAADLAGKVGKRLDGLDKMHDFYRAERYDTAREWLDTAKGFDPEDAEVKRVAPTVEEKIAEDKKNFEAKIDARKWPEHAANAPKDAKKLASVALDWFRNSTGWGKRDQDPRAKDKEPRKPLAVAVTGPWSVQEKNVLGEPIMYGLPILVAVQLDSEKPNNVARVYCLTLRTMEGRGVKMAPPFDHATVGDSYYIRPLVVK